MKNHYKVLLISFFLLISYESFGKENCGKKCCTKTFLGKVCEPVCKSACEAANEAEKVIPKCGGDACKAAEKGKNEAKKVVDKGLKETENFVKDTGKIITTGEAHGDIAIAGVKAVEDTARTVEKAFDDTGKTIEKAAHDTGAELERFAKWICEDVLNIPDGDCNICWTSESSDSEDDGGQFYACEDADPEQGTPPSEYPDSDSEPPTKEELDEMDAWIKLSEITHQELEPYSDGVERFLLGNEILGSPLPDDISLGSPTSSEEIRKKDGYGAGYFLAPRSIIGADGNRVATRYHGGVDFVTSPGEPIFSPMEGKIIRISNAYASNNHGLKAIVIENRGYQAKILYVQSHEAALVSMEIGKIVQKGDLIGTAQKLGVKFGEGMTNHVHLTILDSEGKRVSPDERWKIKKRTE